MKVADLEFVSRSNCKEIGIDENLVGDNTLVFFRLRGCSNDELMEILEYKSWVLRSWKTGYERKYFIRKWGENNNGDKIIWCYAGFSSILIRYLQNRLGYVVNGKEFFNAKEILLGDMRYELWDFQKDAVKEWFNSGCYGIIKAATGSGKCCKFNTLILTDNGLIKIEDIVKGISNLKYCKKSLDYYTKDAEVVDEKIKAISLKGNGEICKFDILNRYDMGISDVINIKTKLGFEICGTPEHKVIIINKDGYLEFKMLKDISNEDNIAISYNTNIFNEKLDLNFRFVDISKYDGCSVVLKNIEHMNTEISRLLGYAISEGNISENRLDITTYDGEMQNDIISICKNIGLDAGYKVDKNRNDGKPIGVIIQSVMFINFMYYMGYIDYAENKEVPWSILQSNMECQIEFLKAMFDGDGTLGFESMETYEKSKFKERYEIEYDSSSYELCRQLQIMLLNMGIISRLRIKKEATIEYKEEFRTYEKSYRLVITGGEILKYASIIGFGLTRKKEVLQEYVDILNSRERWTDIVYPNIHGKLNILYQKLKEKGKGIDKSLVIEQKVKYPSGDIMIERKVVTSHAYLKHHGFKMWSYISGERTPGKDTLEYILKVLDPVSNCGEWKYLNWLKENFIFDRVEKIIEGKERVYDVTVNEVHSYIGNGVVNHNTIIGCAIIKRLGVKTIIVVHTSDLLIGVWFNRLIEQFGEGIRSKIGIIGGGLTKRDRKIMRVCREDFEENIGKDIVIATSQSLLNKLDRLGKEKFGLLLYDEIHHSPAEQFKNVVNSIRAPARLALSATLIRPDGMSPMMQGLIGDVVYRIGIKELVNKGILVEPIFNTIVIDDPECTSKINKMKKGINDMERVNKAKQISGSSVKKKDYILQLCSSLVLNNKKFMMYTDWVTGENNGVFTRDVYVELLKEKGIRCIGVSSEMSGKEREEVFKYLKNDKIDGIVFGRLGNEGVDIPNVDSVIMCNCTASTILFPQRTGRAMRISPGKKNAFIYEILLDIPKELQWSKENFFEYGSEGYIKERIWLDKNGNSVKKEMVM